MTPAEGVQALIKARERVERATAELEAAKAERKELEEVILPPLFFAAGIGSLSLPNGARATKSQFVWARLAPHGDPKRAALIKWLRSVGEQDALKATLTAQWGYGDYDTAVEAQGQLAGLYPQIPVVLEESIQWKSLESIVLDKVKSGLAVPLSEINATFGDHVTITRNAKDPTL